MDFDDIRPYTDKELPVVLKKIISNKWLLEGVRKLYFPKLPKILIKPIDVIIFKILVLKTSGIKTTNQFRKKISLDLLVKNLVRNTTAGISSTGLGNLDLKKKYIFISNHRDIVLDAAFMIQVLYSYGFNFPQIAFGDNLMINEVITDIIRSNNGIIVKRNLPMRDQIRESLKLSAYMCKVIDEGSSIWLAQREGRAKDGLDNTNPAVLKMLYLSKRKEMKYSEFLERYQIVPVAISYEYDPLDRSKGWSIYRKRIYGFHIKRKFEDLILHLLKKGFFNFNFTKIGKQWGKIPKEFKPEKGRDTYEIDIVALNEQTREILFAECKWQEKVNAKKICKELAEKAQYVQWHNAERRESFAIFAKSFSKKINEFEGRKVYCFDLRDLEKTLNRKIFT